MKHILATAVFACGFLLSGCGGGGGSPGEPIVASFPVKQAVVYAYTHGLQQNFNVTGTAINGTTSRPLTGSLTFNLGQASSATFNAITGLQSTTTISGSVTIGSQTTPLNASGIDFLDAAYGPIGSTSTGQYCVASTAGATFPVTAAAGQTANIVTFNCYTDSTKTLSTGSESLSYATTAGSATNTLDVKLITTIYNASNQLAGTGSLTYTITSAGIPSLTHFGMVATSGDISMTIAGDATPAPSVPTALQITDVTLGTGAVAASGNILTVNYTGWLYDATAANFHGTQFDSSLSAARSPFQFTLGTGHVISGWDQGLVGMKVGGKRTLIIPSSMAYGSTGAGTSIPPNAALVFDVSLVSIP